MKARLLIFSIALSLLAAGCGNSKAADPAKGQMPAMQVGIQVLQPTAVEDASEFVATLRSRDSTTISPQVEGQITHISVRSGDHVKTGQELMQIDPLKQQATVGTQQATRAAKLANVRYAEQQFQRTKQLFADGVVAKQDLDNAQQAVDAARAELRALDAQVTQEQVQLHYFRIVAPSDGTVGDVPVHVGDRVTTSTVLTTVDRSDKLEAYISVPVERAADLKLKKPVQIVDSDGKVINQGEITFISPRVDDQTQSILVKSSVQSQAGLLRTDQFARARIVWGSHQGLKVPVLAVSRINGQFFVFVADGSEGSFVAHQKQVHLGDIVGNDYTVIDGINPGDRLIVSGTQVLGDGMPVAPKSS